MKNYIYILPILFTLISCKNKEQSKIPVSTDNQSLSIKQIIDNFNKGLKDGDTLILDFNLAMEQYIRVDTVFVEKKQKKVLIKSIINEKVEEVDNNFSTQKPSTTEYNLNNKDSLSLEHFLNKNLYRTDKKEAFVYTLKIHFKNDSLTFYSYNLSDKAQFIKQYFNTMNAIYPNTKIFSNQEEVFPSTHK